MCLLLVHHFVAASTAPGTIDHIMYAATALEISVKAIWAIFSENNNKQTSYCFQLTIWYELKHTDPFQTKRKAFWFSMLKRIRQIGSFFRQPFEQTHWWWSVQGNELKECIFFCILLICATVLEEHFSCRRFSYVKSCWARHMYKKCYFSCWNNANGEKWRENSNKNQNFLFLIFVR